MEEASGEDLEGFFQQWLYQGGFPVLDVIWSYSEAAKSLSITIDQVQTDGFAFEIPVELGIVSGESGTPRIETVVSSTGSTATVTLQLEQRPSTVVVDPRTRLLTRWTVKARD